MSILLSFYPPIPYPPTHIPLSFYPSRDRVFLYFSIFLPFFLFYFYTPTLSLFHIPFQLIQNINPYIYIAATSRTYGEYKNV